MSRKFFYLPKGEEARATWLNNIAAKLPALQKKYNLSDDEVKYVITAAAYWQAVVNSQKQVKEYAHSFTDFKDAIAGGLPKGTAVLEVPQALVLSLPPDMAEPDIFGRIATIVNKIKAHEVYTEADGQNLGIEGQEHVVDEADAKPVLTLSVNGRSLHVGWVKGPFTSIEIWKDSGDGAWVMLALDTVPDYIDTSALPAKGVSSVWSYKAMYRLGDEPVGRWSDVVSITIAE